MEILILLAIGALFFMVPDEYRDKIGTGFDRLSVRIRAWIIVGTMAFILGFAIISGGGSGGYQDDRWENARR